MGRPYNFPNFLPRAGRGIPQQNTDVSLREERNLTVVSWMTGFFFFSFCHPVAYGVPGQGSDPSRSCNLHCSWGDARSFNPLCGAGDRTCRSTLCPGAAETPAILVHRSENSWVTGIWRAELQRGKHYSAKVPEIPTEASSTPAEWKVIMHS